MTEVLRWPGFMIAAISQLVAIAGFLSGVIAPPVALAVIHVQFVVGLGVTYVECRTRLGDRSGVVS